MGKAKRRAAPLQKPRDVRKAAATPATDETETVPTLKRHGPCPDRRVIEDKLQDLEGVLEALSIVVWEKCNLPDMHGVTTLVRVAEEKAEVLRNTIWPEAVEVDVADGVSVQFGGALPRPRVVRDF